MHKLRVRVFLMNIVRVFFSLSLSLSLFCFCFYRCVCVCLYQTECWLHQMVRKVSSIFQPVNGMMNGRLTCVTYLIAHNSIVDRCLYLFFFYWYWPNQPKNHIPINNGYKIDVHVYIGHGFFAMRSLNTEQRLKEAKKRFMANFFFRLSHVLRFFFHIFIININIIIIIILFVQVSAVPCAIAFKIFDVVPFDFFI